MRAASLRDESQTRTDEIFLVHVNTMAVGHRNHGQALQVAQPL